MAANQAVNPASQQTFLFSPENAGLLKRDKKPEGHKLSSDRVVGSEET